MWFQHAGALMSFCFHTESLLRDTVYGKPGKVNSPSHKKDCMTSKTKMKQQQTFQNFLEMTMEF